jgi:pantoate--beta-alanine ligase
MRVIERASEMRAWSDETRGAGRRVALVPTMGYLHAGHLSLVGRGFERAGACVVSIFVNPLQFGPGEDLERYPRDLEGDSRLLREARVDVLYLPSAAAMYPEGFQTEVAVGEVTRELCGRSRPGHFRGVTTVVAKLFNAVRPDVAVFGEKDYQQLAAIRRMVADLDFGIEVVGAPIVREADGLALSSRNTYLSTEERRAATCLSRALAAAQTALGGGERSCRALLQRVRGVIAAEPLARVDYAEIVDAGTIRPVDSVAGEARLAVAVHVGRVRLIDNALLRVGAGE